LLLIALKKLSSRVWQIDGVADFCDSNTKEIGGITFHGDVLLDDSKVESLIDCCFNPAKLSLPEDRTIQIMGNK